MAIILTYYLLKKRQVVHRGRVRQANFKKGIYTLVVIMLTFSMSYLVRVLCDTFVINYNAMACFKSIMID